MKVGTFLIGGIVGASAVMYWNRRGRQAAFSAISHQAGNMMNQAIDKTKDVVKATSHMKAKFDPDHGLDTVEEIVNRDPELKKHVDEIIRTQGESRHKESHALTQ